VGDDGEVERVESSVLEMGKNGTEIKGLSHFSPMSLFT